MPKKFKNRLWLWFDSLMRATGKKYTLPLLSDIEVDTIIIKKQRSANASEWISIKITDKDTIQSVINFFDTRKDNWMRPWDTVPAGVFSITLSNSNGSGQSFFVSGGVMVTFHDGGHLWRFLNTGDYDELATLLGIEPYEQFIRTD
ncbi:MAG: hypothetical protein AAFR67_00380 [Chloroflexota bacterium]